MRRVRVWGASSSDMGVPPVIGGMRDPQEDGEPGPEEPAMLSIHDPVVENDPCRHCGCYIVPWNLPWECDACLEYQNSDFHGSREEWDALQEKKR